VKNDCIATHQRRSAARMRMSGNFMLTNKVREGSAVKFLKIEEAD
jgi:hypothetical protein